MISSGREFAGYASLLRGRSFLANLRVFPSRFLVVVEIDGLVTQCGGPHHGMRGSTDPRAHAGVGLCHAGGEHEATGSERAVREGVRSGKANWQD